MEELIYAIRGAISTDFDAPLNIDRDVNLLMDEIYERNGISDKDISHIIFSQTVDLRSRNAAAAFRSSGRGAHVPLFCVQEAEIYGSLPHMIRVLVVVNHKRDREPVMVYLKEARKLRPDLSDPQA